MEEHVNITPRASCRDLVAFIGHGYRSAAEIGIGHFPDVGFAIKDAGVDLFATDIASVKHDGLAVFVDDVTAPDFSLYEGVQVVYSIRPPPELVPYMVRLAQALKADLIIKPLSSDYFNGTLVGKGRGTFFFWGHHEKETGPGENITG